jgi:hypothetical protein
MREKFINQKIVYFKQYKNYIEATFRIEKEE